MPGLRAPPSGAMSPSGIGTTKPPLIPTHNTKGDAKGQDSAQVVRSELLYAPRDPSRLGQLECDLGCDGLDHTRADRTSLSIEWPMR